jgi:hypothetical protein
MKWIEESYYLRLPSGPPMQGDIWSSLPLPYAPSATCTGIVITPRCDLVHDKTLSANYLPLLPLDEFMETHGHFELLEQELQDAEEALRRAAEPLDMKEVVELELPIEALLAELLERPSEKASELGIAPARFEKYLTLFAAAKERIDRIKALLRQSRISVLEFSPQCNPKAATKYKLGVARNTVGDLHFLPPCKDLLDRASVVLLRRVATCSIDLLRLAENCMSQSDWDALRAQQTTPDFRAAANKPERLLRLKSPYLESLMFRFGAFFGRVGTRDIERHQLETYVGSPQKP